MVWTKDFIYFGSSDFSSQILSGLLAAGLRPLLVVSTQAKPSGRGLEIKETPVSLLAKQNSLNLIQVKGLKKGLPPELKNAKAEFGLLAAFGRILPAELLNLYPYGIINVHPSLLPLYRGASPIQYALLDGAGQTGVSLIKLDEEVDHGPILEQRKIDLDQNITAEDLKKVLADLTIKMLLESVPDYLSGKTMLRPQDHSQATFTKLITKEDGRADFNLPAQSLNNRRRAFTPWPGLWTSWQGQKLKLIETGVINDIAVKAGLVADINEELAIGCANKSALIIKTLQLEGGKAQTAKSFLNGHKNILNSVVPS